MRQVLSLGVVCLLVACGGDSPSAPFDVPGTYHLISVDGQALPAAVTDVGDDGDPEPATITLRISGAIPTF